MTFKFNNAQRKVDKINTKYRTINSNLPSKGYLKKFKQIKEIESRSMHGQIPILWKNAINYSVYDDCKNKWIDFTSGIFVANIGHSNKKLKKYITDTQNKNLISSYNYLHDLRVEYINKLLKNTKNHFQKAFLLSAGTETTEVAFKLMKLHGQTISLDKRIILSFKGNWQGRTMGAQLLSSNQDQKKWIDKNKNIIYLNFPYPSSLKDTDPIKFIKKEFSQLKKNNVNLLKNVCGVMMESFQGWGAYFYPKEIVKYIREIAYKNDILLAFDEMQAGFGRTGKFFGYENYDIVPDLVCIGKGMGGGLPISGVLGSKKILDIPDIGSMSSTHSANPLCCAAGLAVLDEMKSKDLINQAKSKGKVMHKILNSIKDKNLNIIESIEGRGLIAAIIFKKNKNYLNLIGQVVEKCFEKGLLLVFTGRESIKIGPPLTISISAMKEGLKVLDEVICDISKKYDEIQ